jgi:hypothetical protein
VGRGRIRPPGEIGYLSTDLYDATANELYEVKAMATREAVRRAIGQLLHHRRPSGQETPAWPFCCPSGPPTTWLI